MKIPQSKKLVVLLSIFAIGSFYANCCGGPDDDDKELPVKLIIPGETPKSMWACAIKGAGKAVEKTVTNEGVTALKNIAAPMVDWLVTRYAAARKFAQFKNTQNVFNHNEVVRLKNLSRKVLENACAYDCCDDDFKVIVERVKEFAHYGKARFKKAQNEYARTLKVNRSLFQHATHLLTRDYDVHSILQMIEWITIDLEELYERSQHTKDFDINQYKKIVCYLQADLDTLFTQLEEIV